MKRVSLFLLLFAIGCGGNQPASPKADSAPPSGNASASANPATVGKPSEDEAVASIREYCTDPGSGVGYLNVDVEKVSAAVEAPKEVAAGTGEAWAYSVDMTCESIVGDKLHAKNWLMLIGRENGKVKVKDCYHDLERASTSPLGKDWWAKNGFPEPSIE